MRYVYLVRWPRGDMHTYSTEASARSSMLDGDRLYRLDLMSMIIEVL